MKRLLIGILLSLLLSQNVLGQSIHASRDSIIEAEIQTKENVLLINYSSIGELFDLQVSYSNEIVKMNDLGNELIFTVDSKEARFNGQAVALTISPIKDKESVYIPLETVAELFCYEITSIGGHLVLTRSLNDDDQKSLEEISLMLEQQEDYLKEALYTIDLYNRFKAHDEKQAKEIWNNIKSAFNNVAIEEAQLINDIKVKHQNYTPLAKLISNNVIAILELQKSYFESFPLDKEENEALNKQVEAAYDMLRIQEQKLMTDYYGFETKETIYNIISTFNVAEDYIYINKANLTDDEKEECVLMLQAKRMRLEYIKKELKEKEIIELANRCITIIEDNLQLLEIANALGTDSNEILKQNQEKLDKAIEELYEEFWYRHKDLDLIEIDDAALSGEGEKLISSEAMEKLSVFKKSLLELAEQLDILSAKYVGGLEINSECIKFEKELEKLSAEYISLKKVLKNLNCESYLVTKEDLINEIQAIYSQLKDKTITYEQLLKVINKMEEKANNLYLKGYYIYVEY